MVHLGDWEHATAAERLEELRVLRWACVCVLRIVCVKGVRTLRGFEGTLLSHWGWSGGACGGGRACVYLGRMWVQNLRA